MSKRTFRLAPERTKDGRCLFCIQTSYGSSKTSVLHRERQAKFCTQRETREKHEIKDNSRKACAKEAHLSIVVFPTEKLPDVVLFRLAIVFFKTDVNRTFLKTSYE